MTESEDGSVEGSDLLFLHEILCTKKRKFVFGNETLEFEQEPVPGDTSTSVWPSSIRLAYFVYKSIEVIRKALRKTGRLRIVELGCGRFPLVSLASSLVGNDVIATDLSAVVTSMKLDIASHPITVQALDWKQIGSSIATEIDLIVGADLIFDESLHQHLVSTIKRILEASSKDSFMILCWQLRDRKVETCFFNLLESCGLSFMVVPQKAEELDAVELSKEHMKYTRIARIYLS